MTLALMHSRPAEKFQAQAGEALEITIEGAEDGAVLDRDCGEVGVGDEVADAATGMARKTAIASESA